MSRGIDSTKMWKLYEALIDAYNKSTRDDATDKETAISAIALFIHQADTAYKGQLMQVVAETKAFYEAGPFPDIQNALCELQSKKES